MSLKDELACNRIYRTRNGQRYVYCMGNLHSRQTSIDIRDYNGFDNHHYPAKDIVEIREYNEEMVFNIYGSLSTIWSYSQTIWRRN